jgi:uncharacterized protein (TIGR00369 family)
MPTFEGDPQALVGLMPFAAALGIEVDTASPEEVRGRMEWAEERCTAGGLMHGGALMSFADSLGAILAFLNLPEGATTSTISSSTNLTRGVREGTVHAVSRPLHAGRTVIVVQTEMRDDEGRLVAQVTQAQAVIAAG